MVGIAGFLENPPVEMQPRQLAIDVALGSARRNDRQIDPDELRLLDGFEWNYHGLGRFDHDASKPVA
jgi:hypothetical protein